MTSGQPLTIGIILGSTRPGRRGEAVAHWVQEQASTYPEVADGSVALEVLDVAAFNLSLLGEPTVPGAANRNYENAETRAWSAAIDACDGFIWVTPEYNHGVPAAMKNAFDVLAPEWGHKAAGLVAYGADGGVRAVEHWRTIMANAHLVAVRGQVSLSMFTDWDGATFAPAERRAGELQAVFDHVVTLSRALSAMRS